MKKSLRFKFIFSYLIIALLTLILLNTYGQSTIYNKLIEYEKAQLYDEADLIARRYVPDISIFNANNMTIRQHFHSLETLTSMRVWLVTPSGDIIMDSSPTDSCQEKNINEYDTSFLAHQSIVGAYPTGLMKESMISVIYPITESVTTNGYVVLMSPTSTLDRSAASYIDAIVICGFIILSISAVLFLYLHYQAVKPLRTMTAAAREYADGHFNYPMKKVSNHEQAELASAICYLAEQMNHLDEYQKNFVANVSHDFRSPLTSIKGYTEALADGTIPPTMQEKYFNIILYEVERLNKLTSSLLELNHVEHGGMILEKVNFDINDTIKKSSLSFEQRCREKQISLDLIFEQKELQAYGDAGKIGQVIQNLLDNAIKFSHYDSTITIHTLQRNHKIFVSVKDHGIGIPKSSLKKIWNRFYKTDISRGKDKTGTGLGLSITREIIDAHGENINVISTEGVGTEFIFSLPCAKE